MEKFILSADPISILNAIPEQKLLDKLAKLKDSFDSWFGQTGFNIKDANQTIGSLVSKVLAYSDEGKYIPNLVAQKMKARFEGKNPAFFLPNQIVGDFIGKIKSLENVVPNGSELGVRIYVGYNAKQEYNMVLVPCYAPKSPSVDHSKIVEITFLANNGGFFALLPGTQSIVYDVAICKNYITNIDPTGVKGAFFNFGNFLNFIKALELKSYTTLQMSFARTITKDGAPDNNLLTVILEGFKVNDIITIDIAQPYSGISFDQGGLFPPPSNYSDSSFV